MKYLILAFLLLFGCNNQNSYDCAKSGDACHVQSKGDPGQEGTQGVTGSPGAVGETGQNGLAGTDGKDGLSGTNSNRWYSGYINPVDTFGNDSDFYLNLTTGDIYNKVDSTWGSPVANIMGPQGTQGIAGPSGPSGSDGVDGLNGSDGSNGTNGTAGIDGINGLDGAKGDVGDVGPQGATGQTGPVGATGATGSTGAAGADGQSAILSSGPVGPRVTGKSYSACHHDYLYLSNGWLLFRHQANGTADQGAGTTGFEVWDVDISDFLLISEVGNVTYCTLHYDQNTLKLTGIVNDNSDGFAGTQINIDL